MSQEKSIKKVSLDPLSYTSVPINLFSEDKTELARATAFFYKHNKYFLITNWHNVTGFDAEKRRLLDVSPVIIEVPFLKQKKPYIRWGRWNIPLYKNKKPIWCIHPQYRNKVDVVAIELGINDKQEDVLLLAVNDIELDDMNPQIGDDVFILGFPYLYKGGGNFPIWKRGSIASEPDIDIEGLPKIFVDTASRSGMSGAPVIYRRRGVHNLSNNGIPTDETLFGEIQNFIGIYSGRVKRDNDPYDLKAQLGIVWKKQVIEEIINAKLQEDIYYPDL